MDSTDREKTRNALMDKAEAARKRIVEGIRILGEDAVARRAFCLMNDAMAAASEQRGRKDPAWRLFQLAFVLLNVRGIVDPACDERKKVELIFFPTGGGKTEAYLGLVAFTLLLRRLNARERADGGLGVAVLLRYTLRLLTLDQLGRAATLMCALELIRRESPAELGTERFAIGLWVGRSATANTLKELSARVETFKLGRGGSPFPARRVSVVQPGPRAGQPGAPAEQDEAGARPGALLEFPRLRHARAPGRAAGRLRNDIPISHFSRTNPDSAWPRGASRLD